MVFIKHSLVDYLKNELADKLIMKIGLCCSPIADLITWTAFIFPFLLLVLTDVF